jgi:hypothetical protein
VRPGDEHTSKHSAPGLWALLDRLPRERWPALVRGDAHFGVEPIMAEAEAKGLPYLFKLRLTANVKRMIEKLAGTRAWIDAGAGFQAKESFVRLTGCSRQRAIVCGDDRQIRRAYFSQSAGVWRWSPLPHARRARRRRRAS